MAERDVYLQSIHDGGLIEPLNNVPIIDSVWLNADNCVIVNKDYFEPNPTIQEWFYDFQTKRRFIHFPIPLIPIEASTVAWEIPVPRYWNKRYIYYTPYWTYKYGNQGGDNPDQPGYVDGNFMWEIVSLIYPASEAPATTYHAGWLDHLMWSVPSIETTDLVYAGKTKSLISTGNFNNDTNILLVQLWRDDIIQRAVDVSGIRVEFVNSQLEER